MNHVQFTHPLRFISRLIHALCTFMTFMGPSRSQGWTYAVPTRIVNVLLKASEAASQCKMHTCIQA